MGAAAVVGAVLMAAVLSGVAAPMADGKPGEWRVLAKTPATDFTPRGFAKFIPVPDLDLAVIWGPPAKSGKDWCALSYDLAANSWKPLLPAGKETWLTTPPMRSLGMRWGGPITLAQADGLLQPVPMCYFNQAVYVPAMKKVYFFVGGKHLTLDPRTGLWEELAPKPSPPHVLWSALCYDPTNDEVVLFGGGAQCDENRPGTWLMNARTGEWRPLEQPLTEQPPARCNAPLAYDSKHQLIALFGGDAQDRFLSDTWVYDCTRRRWRELKTNVRPYPRSAPALCYLEKEGVFLMGGAAADRSASSAGSDTWLLDAAAGTWTRVLGEFPSGVWNSAFYDAKRGQAVVYQTAAKDVSVWSWQPSLTPAPADTADAVHLAPDALVTRWHAPEWYTDGVEPTDPKAVEQVLASLKPNEWTRVDLPRYAAMRTWGSAAVDTDRQEVLYWGGGHCGYCGTDVNHFSLKTLRWTTSFLPEFPALPYNAFYGDESSFIFACRSLKGRPFVQHGRTSYAYDPVSKTVAFTQSPSMTPGRDWTYIYDPAKREFVDRFTQPFAGGYSVSGAVCTTRHGVCNYLTKGDHRSAEVGLFKLDVKARQWTNLSGGQATVPCVEHHRMIYDGKRDRLIVVSAEAPGPEKPAMWAWDLAAPAGARTDWVKLPMTGDVPRAFFREGDYLPRYDTILHLTDKDGLYACDLAAGNIWRKVNAPLPKDVTGGWNTTMVYVPGADVMVLISGPNMGRAPVWLMRYAPAKD
jgi:hypothetical protein